MIDDLDQPEHIAWEGEWVVAKTRGKWEYVSRARQIRAAVVVAIEDGHILLVEQFRVPLDRRSLELPAGLIGDDEGGAGEDPLQAAGRELEEETGYRAAHLEDCGAFYSSPGMLTESFTLVRATGLEKVGDGGGTDNEDIKPYRVPLAEIADFIAERRVAGVGVDVRLLMLLGPHLFPELRA